MGWLGTLLGGLMGFGASTIPEIISVVRAHYFHKFAMEAADKGHVEVMAQLATQQDTLEALQATISGVTCKPSWIDMLSNTVRPVLTYLFFVMFFLIKTTALYHIIMHEHTEFFTAMPLIWDAETSSLFAAIISFWFGSKALAAASGTATLPTSSPSRVTGLVNGDEGKN